MDKIWDLVRDNPMAAAIAAGEIGFWVLIVAGLVARYPLRMRRTGLVLLAATPVIDLALLVVTMVDVGRGAQAGTVHGLAAVYLGFSVVFGHSMIRWADVRFAHRFAGGPPPVKKSGLRYEWREWGKCVLACTIAAAFLLVLIFVVGTPEQTRALWDENSWLIRLGIITAIWFAVGPLWQTLSGKDSASHTERQEAGK